MRPERILELLRPLVLVCDREGFIREAHGGFGGVADRATADLVGRHSLELLSEDDAVSLASVFLQGVDRDDFTVPQPIPFVVHMTTPDGGVHPADVVATGVVDGDEPGWIVVITPHDRHTAPVAALTDLLDAAPLRQVLTSAVDHLSGSGADGRRLAGALVIDGVDGLDGGEPHILRSALPLVVADELGRALDAANSAISTAAPLEQLRADALPAGLVDAMSAHGYEELIVAPIDSAPGERALLVVANGPARDPLPGNVAQLVERVSKLIALALRSDRELRALEHASTHDALTGLGNRRHLEASIASLGSEVAAVLFVDVDRFKSINDEYGHAVGDAVLVALAERLTDTPGPDRIACRLGGDEFVLLLPGVDHEEVARPFVDRLRIAVAAPLSIPHGPHHVTASIGLAHGRPFVSSGDLIAAADLAMQADKSASRPVELRSLASRATERSR